MSSKNKIIRNGIANLFQKTILGLDQLLLVPFFISAWGVSYYGEWISLTIIPSVLAFSDLGLGAAAANSFVLKYASGEKQEAANIVKTAVRIISLAIGVGFLLAVIILALSTYFGFFQKTLINAHDATIAISLLIAARLLSFYNQLYEAHFRAARKAALGINLTTCLSILNLVFGSLVLLNGGKVIEFASVTFLVAIVFNFTYAKLAVHTLPVSKEFKGIFNKAEAKRIAKTGFGYLMNPMWQVVLFQGTTLIVRIVLGPKAVAIFNTLRTLSRSVNQMYGIVNASIFPEIQVEIGAGNMDNARMIFIKAIKIVSLVAITGVIGLAIFGLPVYGWWTKNAIDPPQFMWNIFIAATAFNALWWTSAVVFRAVNKPYLLSVAGLICSLLAILVTFLGSKFAGLTGAAVGSLVFEITMALYVLPVSFKIMSIRL